jgi:hypothetical protein
LVNDFDNKLSDELSTVKSRFRYFLKEGPRNPGAYVCLQARGD